MVAFGDEVGKNPKRDGEVLKQLSPQLAHSIRHAIAPAFDVEATDLAGLRTRSTPGR
jgi:hypothetical protein